MCVFLSISGHYTITVERLRLYSWEHLFVAGHDEQGAPVPVSAGVVCGEESVVAGFVGRGSGVADAEGADGAGAIPWLSSRDHRGNAPGDWATARLQNTWDSQATSEGQLSKYACATVGALIWALHPLQVEPVAWATAIGYVQGTFFMLLALLGYVLFLSGQGRNPRRFYWMSLLAFAVSLTTYPIALGCPPVFVILDWWWRRQQQYRYTKYRLWGQHAKQEYISNWQYGYWLPFHGGKW